MFILKNKDVEYCQVFESNSIESNLNLRVKYRGFIFEKIATFIEKEKALTRCREFLDRENPVMCIIIKELYQFTVWLTVDNKNGFVCNQNDSTLNVQNKKAENLSAITIESIVEKMRGKGGLEIKTRWFNLKPYSNSFTGIEAVDWLINNEKLNQDNAIKLGQILVREKIIHHVLNEHDFKNEFLFYRFYQDE